MVDRESSSSYDYCQHALQIIRINYVTLTLLPIVNILPNLLAKNVITLKERNAIRILSTTRRKMEYFLNYIITSLKVGDTVKFKSFLEVMEESDDSSLIAIAKEFNQQLRAINIEESSMNTTEQFQKYLEKAKRDNETENISLYKVVIFGPPRVGKSSLFKVLLGEIPEKYSESTGICERLIFKVAITKDVTGFKSTWHRIKIEDEISRLQSSLEEKQKLENPVTKEKLPAIDIDPSKEALLDVEKNMIQNLTAKPQFHKEVHYTNTLMVCYDSGGQPEFFDVMPSLATNPTGYIMVVDMSKDLSKPIESKVRMRKNEFTLPQNITSMDLLKNAMASIQSGKNNKLSQNLLVVGTHLDQCTNPEETIPQLDKQIFKNLMQGDAESLYRPRQENEGKRAIDQTQIIHPIANLFECTDSSQSTLTESKDRDSIAQEIRSAIEEMANRDDIRKELPINWLLFQLETQLKIGKKYIPRHICIEYAEKCYIKEEEIDFVLTYFHKLGIILYYKDSVEDIVFSPQWLFNRLSDIIFEKYNPKCNYNAAIDIKKGNIAKEFLVDLYKGKIDRPLTVDKLLTIFEDQCIMARYPADKNNFFMPALLNPVPEGLLTVSSTLPGKKIYETLYVKFDKQYFPRGVFCSVATQFIKMNYLIQDKPLYNNVLVFQVPYKDNYIGLFDCKTKLAIEMYQKIDKNNEDPSELPHELCRTLYQFLIISCEKVQIDCNFKFGFTCKWNECSLFAGVEVKYPFLPKKICKNCGNSKLKYEELVWMTSPKSLIDILNENNETHHDQLQKVSQKGKSLSPKDAIRHFGVRLLTVLPLDSVIFLTLLDESEFKLLPFDYRDRIISLPTRAEKVSFFKDKVLKPSPDLCLPALLDVMDKCDDAAVLKLSIDIRKETALCIKKMSQLLHILLVYQEPPSCGNWSLEYHGTSPPVNLENEIDPQEGADDVLDHEWEKEQRRELEEDIWIIQESQRPQHGSWLTIVATRCRASLGGACGSIHNLVACSWKWASYVRIIVRNSKELPVIIALVEANHDPVIRAATTALRNLAIDPRNKAIIGDQAMGALTTRLPFGPRHIGLSDSTTIAILCALIELISESPQNAKSFRSRGGVLLAVKLARSKQHVPKIVFAANKLCSVLSDYKESYSALKREGWDISHYTRAAKDTGYSLEFEPRGITTKDLRTSGHSKSSKKRREKGHSKSSTSLAERSGIELPPSPVPSTVPSNATTNLGIERQSSPALNFEPNYDMVESTRQKPTSQSVPNLGTMGTYAVIPENSAPSNDQQAGSSEVHFDPNAVYAQVDKNKKRSTRRSTGKDDFAPAQHAPYPVDETTGGDSWV